MTKILKKGGAEFDLEGFLQLFEDKALQKRAFSAYFILGQITSVASAPELILPSEWLSILSVDPEEALEFDDISQTENFHRRLQDWWNVCVTHFDEEAPIGLIEKLEFSIQNGPSTELKDFIDGYLFAYDWLFDVWGDYLEEESEESSLLGLTTLMALQISRWPEELMGEEEETEALPNLVAEFKEDPKEIMVALASLIASVGQIGLEILREDDDEVRAMPVTDSEPKVGPNDLCPCGSGKKFKKCCLH